MKMTVLFVIQSNTHFGASFSGIDIIERVKCLHLNARIVITAAAGNIELLIILSRRKAFHEIPRMSLLLSALSSATMEMSVLDASR